MILGAGIALIVVGIMALIRGQMKFSNTKVVTGTPAYVLGVLSLFPLPLALAAASIYSAGQFAKNPGRDPDDMMWTVIGIQAAIVLGGGVLICIVGFAIGRPPEKERRRRRDEDSSDDDARPTHRYRRDEDDEDRPRRRYQDQDDDDRPHRRRTRRDDDDDRPRRRRRDDD